MHSKSATQKQENAPADNRPRHDTIGSLTAARRLRHEFTPRPARSTNRPRLRISVRDAARELHDRPRAVLQWAEPRDAALYGAQSLGRALQGGSGCAAGRPASATAEVLRPNGRGWRPHTFPETWTASSAPRCDQNATGCALSGGAIRASLAGRSCWSPPMRRPAEHGQRGKASSSISSTATYLRSRSSRMELNALPRCPCSAGFMAGSPGVIVVPGARGSAAPERAAGCVLIGSRRGGCGPSLRKGVRPPAAPV